MINQNKHKKSAVTCQKIRMAYIYERQEFAKLLGISYNCIFKYENGLRTPKMSTIRQYVELAEKKNIKLGIEDFQD